MRGALHAAVRYTFDDGVILMDRHHDPVELCHLLDGHYRRMGAAMDGLQLISTSAEMPEPEKVRPEMVELKGRIVLEANKILSLLSP